MFSFLQQIESGLSPPYDGSEMDDLFPDLAGVESTAADKENDDHDDVIMLDSPEDGQLMNYFMKKVSPSENQELDSNNRSCESSEDDNPNRNQWVVSINGKSRRVSGGKTRPRVTDMTEQEENEPGLNRNAIMARLNRQKKKKYLQELETSVKSLKKENKTLNQDKKVLVEEVDKLETEVRYLKGVIANQSELSSLLQNIGVTGLRLHSSFPHNTSSKEQNSRLDTIRASISQSQTLKQKESDHESSQSDTDLENEIPVNKQRPAKRSRSTIDHDYTLPASTKEQDKTGDENSPPPAKVKTSQPQINLRSCNVRLRRMTRSTKTITTQSGQKVKQTVVTLGKPNAEKGHGAACTKETQPQMNHGAESGEAAGVCLHVSSGSVSLEFCAHCSDRAKAIVAAGENPADEDIEVVD